MISSYHPQTNGQSEVINRCLETYLCCFVFEQPNTWSIWIPWAEWCYTTTYHVFTGTTFFKIVYGHKPPTILCLLQGEIQVELVAHELIDKDEALKQLKLHLQHS